MDALSSVLVSVNAPFALGILSSCFSFSQVIRDPLLGEEQRRELVMAMVVACDAHGVHAPSHEDPVSVLDIGGLSIVLV